MRKITRQARLTPSGVRRRWLPLPVAARTAVKFWFLHSLASCSQCSVCAPPRLRKSGFARRLKQFTKYRSTETSLCSHSCGCWFSSKVRFCFDTAGVKYSSVTSVWPMSASALNNERSSSSAPTPPSTMRGFLSSEAALPSSTAFAKSATVMRFIALAFFGFANVDFRARTPTVRVRERLGRALVLRLGRFALRRLLRFELEERPLHLVDGAAQQSCTLVPMPLSTACFSSASASSRVFS